MALVKVLSSAWSALAPLYRLPGQDSAPPGLELGLPTQLVHDLSREAEFARQEVCEYNTSVAPAAGAVARTSITRANIFNQSTVQTAMQRLGIQSPGEIDVWVDSIDALIPDASDPADFVLATAGMLRTGPGHAGSMCFLLWTADTVFPDALQGAGFSRQLGLSSTAVVPPRPMPYPVRMGDGALSSLLMLAEAGAGGGVTIFFNWTLRLTPRRVRPAGLA